jgi:hypothetical protein
VRLRIVASTLEEEAARSRQDLCLYRESNAIKIGLKVNLILKGNSLGLGEELSGAWHKSVLINLTFTPA